MVIAHGDSTWMRCDCGSGVGSIDDVAQKNARWQENVIRTTLKDLQIMEGKRCRFIVLFRSSAISGMAARGPRDGLVWHREGRKIATRQYRSVFSLDDVAQNTTLARSAHQNNSEGTSKPLEEQCDEFV